MGRLLGRIWVGSTVSLISFIGYSSQLFIVWPSFDGEWSRELLETLVPFNFLLALLYCNYFMCVVTNPGTVPVNWHPDARDEEGDGVEVKKLTGSPRFCRTCRAYKPPRAHHCRQCKRCVLKMDHHCPWVNNCVGHRNYGHFIRFLFMVDIACSYHLWMITKCGFSSIAFNSHPTPLQIGMLVANYATCVPVLIAVGSFSLYHFWCLLVNTTTIEGWEKDKVATLKRKGRIVEFRYPYHLGYLDNVKSVLGSNALLWCVPQRMTIGDGLRYPVGKGVDIVSQYDWPPRDQYADERRAKASATRSQRLSATPFTYGSGLNPDLSPSHTRLRSRGVQRSAVSPYHPDYQRARFEVEADEDVDAQHSAGSNAEDEDLPLSALADRRAASKHGHGGEPTAPLDLSAIEPPPAARVRRGSEGYEVRPMGYVVDPPDTDQQADASWEDGYLGSDVDDEGNRSRHGPRYNIYEPASESGSEDSMDDYLEDHGLL